MTKQDFLGKWVLITGGASGIGQAVVGRFLNEGASVINVDKNEEGLKRIGDTDGINSYSYLQVDLQDASAAQELLLGKVSEVTNRLDIIVNCAGVLISNCLEDYTLDDWDTTMNVNLRSVFMVCKSMFPFLRNAKEASIVNVASTSGFIPQTMCGAYSPSKAGVVLLTQIMAAEWIQYGIRANAVCPGPIETPLTDKLYHDELLRRKRERTIPMGRLGKPEEIASAITFLASRDASYITGSALVVDGGSLISLYPLISAALS